MQDLAATAPIEHAELDVTGGLEEAPQSPSARGVTAAVEAYDRVRADPGDGTDLLVLGELALQRGDLKCSLVKIGMGLEARPADPVAHFMLARALQLSGDLAGAESYYRQTIKLRPEFAMAHGNLSLLLLDTGKHNEALIAAKRASNLDPDLPDIYSTVGRIYLALANWRDSEVALKKAIAIKPECVTTYNALGLALHHLGQSDEASACYRKVLDLEPDNAVAWGGLGRVARACGRFDEAVTYLSHAIQISPEFGEAHCELALCRKARQDETPLTAMANILANETLGVPHRVSAGFGLGKALDDQERYDEAFSSYRQANQILRDSVKGSEQEFDVSRFCENVDQLIQIFTPKFFSANARTGHPSEQPVFVVGLYRSGTSLTEQILATHPEVFGAGELHDVGRIGSRLMPKLVEGGRLQQKAAYEIAVQHLKKINNKALKRLRIVDKHPDNTFWLGLIALLFPNAKIINCHRDPRDNVLSCYFQRFSQYMSFSNDLEDCGRRYLETERLAAHWSRVLPIRILDVQYEALVGNLEGETRRMLDFLGLEWNAACLNYFATERAVDTPSAWAVRQPIYASSVARWKNYQQHLGPLFQVLSEAGLDTTTGLIGFAEVQAAVG